MILKKKHIISLVIAMLFILSLSVGAQDFGGGSFYGGSEETKTSVSGSIFPEFRVFSDGDIEENLRGELDINYPGTSHEFKILMNYQVGAADQIEFSEVYYKYFADNYHLLVGKNRTIWGTGDQVHVVDNLNGEDLSDFINPDYLDRQIGEEMIKIDRYFRDGKADLQFVYTPDFTPDRFADDPKSPLGNWIINPFASYFRLDNIAASSGLSQTEIINKVEDSFKDEEQQFGLRFTDSRSGIDYGLSYYRGYLREPSYDRRVLVSESGEPKDLPAVNNAAAVDSLLEELNLHYDEVDILGFEMATVLGTINSRFELAYFRTDDTDGTDPLTRNNKIGWVIGGDRDLPISNLNLNIQFTGETVLDTDNIKSNPQDLQYNSDGDYTTNRAIVSLEDSYQNEKIIPQLTWVYNLNDNDYTLEAEVDYELQQDLILKFSHKIFEGDKNTTFGQFEENDFTSMALEYSF